MRRSRSQTSMPEKVTIESKVFGIGFQKTGTSSLRRALTILGYRVAGPNWIKEPNIQETVYDKAFALIDEFDAFQDNPWPVLYKEIAERYPTSKFVLTKRPVEDWIVSVTTHFGRNVTPMRTWIYGVGNPVGNEERYKDRYVRHNEEVEEYFRDRPGRLLTMNITQGDGWRLLCPFLGREVPNRPFPHANKSEERAERQMRRRMRQGKLEAQNQGT